MMLTKELKGQLELKIKRALWELGLLDSHKAWLRETDSCSLVITVVPAGRANFAPGMCETITVKGKQCKFQPELGHRLCLMHLTLSKEDEDGS